MNSRLWVLQGGRVGRVQTPFGKREGVSVGLYLQVRGGRGERTTARVRGGLWPRAPRVPTSLRSWGGESRTHQVAARAAG